MSAPAMPPPLTNEQMVQLMTLRSERRAAELAAEWEEMISDPAGFMLTIGSYSWNQDLKGGGVIMSNGMMTVTFEKPTVRWEDGQAPPRPPGPSELAHDKRSVLYALEQLNKAHEDAKGF